MTKLDPVLAKFRAAVSDLYGDRIERVILFGSRARGDAQVDSDYDVALFLKDFSSRVAEKRPLVKIEIALMEETGAFIHALPYPAGAWRRETPLMHEIRREGVDF